jgi:glycosyltransferase involved in cell wall biosynthesis
LIRVLFLTESFHPVLGGGEIHIRMLGGALVREGHTATVVTRRIEADWPAEETLDGVRVVRVGPAGVGRGGKYGMVPRALLAVRRLQDRFDLLVVRGTRVLGLPGMAAARGLGRPVVMQPEINGELSGEAYTWGKAWSPWKRDSVLAATRWRNRWLRRADAFVAMSHEIEDEMRAAGVPAERIARIPHGVDLAEFRPASPGERAALRARLGLPAAATLLTYTGRLLRGKGLDVLIDAFAELAPRFPDARLLLVGSGVGQSLSVEDDLRAQVEARGLRARVVFTGRVDNVADHLRASDVFVFPSLFEALGISLIEAAACGLPCVASDTGGIVDVVDHERTGLLHAPGNAGQLVRDVSRVLSDAGLARALGAAARERAEREFDVKLSLERYRALFYRLCEHGRVRGTV